MKLHLGCGKRYISGWINVDAVRVNGHQSPDLITDRLDQLPYPDGSISEIMAIHLFEHIYPKDADRMLREWFRLLAPGGKLILEMPDVYKSAKNLVKEIDSGIAPSNKWSMWPIYGDNPNGTEYDCHKWGWTYKTLAPLLFSAGFENVIEKDPQFHGMKVNRDFRIEGRK